MLEGTTHKNASYRIYMIQKHYSSLFMRDLHGMEEKAGDDDYPQNSICEAYPAGHRVFDLNRCFDERSVKHILRITRV